MTFKLVVKKKCVAMVVRNYSKPGQCESGSGVKKVRWAPTPLATKVYDGLCTHHRKKLEAGNLFATVS